MISYDGGDPARIQHFIKVYTFAVMIGEGEQLPKETMEILRAAALVHDIGIKVAEEKYGSSDGKLQEKEGPPVARQMLTEIGYPQEVVDRVCYLVGHHHTYLDMDGMDYQILVEADFLVNLFENASTLQGDPECGYENFPNRCRTAHFACDVCAGWSGRLEEKPDCRKTGRL